MITQDPIHLSEIPAMVIDRIDDHSFSVIYDKYAPAIYGRIMAVITDRKTAEKVLEKIFINMWYQRENPTYNVSDFTLLMNEARKLTYEEYRTPSVKFHHMSSGNKE